MGRRSRQRAHEDASSASSPAAEHPPAPAAPRPAARPPSRRAAIDDRPPAPWGAFPLVELCVLVGIVVMVIGVFFSEGDRRRDMLLLGLALASLAGLELAIREHFAGYRSHSVLLAGAFAFVVAAPIWLFVASGYLVLALALAVAGVAFWLLRGAFARRAGGLTFRA